MKHVITFILCLCLTTSNQRAAGPVVTHAIPVKKLSPPVIGGAIVVGVHIALGIGIAYKKWCERKTAKPATPSGTNAPATQAYSIEYVDCDDGDADSSTIQLNGTAGTQDIKLRILAPSELDDTTNVIAQIAATTPIIPVPALPEFIGAGENLHTVTVEKAVDGGPWQVWITMKLQDGAPWSITDSTGKRMALYRVINLP